MAGTRKPLEELQKCCLKGVQSAFKKHHQFTGGYSLRQAPEAFIQGEMACAMGRAKHFVTLESGVKMLLQAAGAEMRGRKPRNGRIDLAVWWKGDRPRYVIEVKKVFSNDSITSDAKRLRQVLGRKGTLRRGLVVVYSDAAKIETLESRFDAIADKSNTTVREKTTVYEFVDNLQRVRYWQAACFVVKPRQ